MKIDFSNIEEAKKAIKKDPEIITTFNGNDFDFQELFEYAKQCGYKFKPRQLTKASRDFKDQKEVMELAILSNPRYILHFDPTSYYGKIYYKEAMDKGLKLYPIDLLNRNVRKSDLLMEYFVKKNPKNIKYSLHSNPDLVKLAMDNGYTPSLSDIKKNSKLRYNDDIMMYLVSKDPSAIKYYYGSSDSVVEQAIKNGYVPNEKDASENRNLYSVDAYVIKLIEKNPDVILKYQGSSEKVLEMAYKNGFNESRMIEILKRNTQNNNSEVNMITQHSFFMRKLIQIDISYFNYYLTSQYGYQIQDNIDLQLVNEAFTKGFIPQADFYERFKHSTDMRPFLLKSNPNFINQITSPTASDYRIAIDNGYVPSVELVQQFEQQRQSIITHRLLQTHPEYFKLYQGNDLDLLAFAISNNIMSVDDLNKRNNLYLVYLYLKKSNDISLVGQFDSVADIQFLKDIIKYDDFDFSLKVFNEHKDFDERTLYNSRDKIMIFKDMIDNSSKDDVLEFILHYSDRDILEYAVEKKLDGVSTDVIDIAKSYQGANRVTFVENAEQFFNLMTRCNVDKNAFITYGLTSSVDYIKIFSVIHQNNAEDNFIKIKQFFDSNFYRNSDSLSSVKNFIGLLRSYSDYPELISDIISRGSIPTEYYERLNVLFNNNLNLSPELVPKSLDDLQNINELMKSNFLKSVPSELQNEDEINTLKNNICINLFGYDMAAAKTIIKIYGGRQGIRQLIFENRNNSELVNNLYICMSIMSFMEDVVNINDPAQLLKLSKNIIYNFDEIQNFKYKYYGNFEEMLRQVYEKEMNSNLTKINIDADISSLIKNDTTNSSGIKTLDFSDKQYCLLVHVMSGRETPEQLINGSATGNMTTICTSIASNRNQALFDAEGRIAFAADTMPEGRFLRSSQDNMSSNGTVGYNSFEDTETRAERIQRGSLATSVGRDREDGFSNNNEVFSLRDGIKFKYIILPNREPTEEEIKIAKENNLMFIYTQPLGKSIDNPKKIGEELLIKESDSKVEKSSVNVDMISQKVLGKNETPRQIAIFCDSHALFEPTLAILEDMRKNGITEIYSLGDNVGLGPNPGEVMELLDEYGVKSLKGNHEGYVVDGLEPYREHLEHNDAVSRAQRLSEYVKSVLTPEQLEKLKSYPEEIQLTVGDKIIYLTHYSKDYNSGQLKEIFDSADKVIQGHVHIQKNDDKDSKIETVRAVGMGYPNGISPADKSKLTAFYTVLTLQPDGTYKSEDREVPYDYNGLYFDINESDMDIADKNQLYDWTGVKR